MAQLKYRTDYQPFPFAVEHCQLAFDILAQYVVVRSTLKFLQNSQYQGQAQNCVLDGAGLEIISLKLDGKVLTETCDYKYTGHKLELLDTAGKQSFIFAAEVKIDPYNNKSLEGLYRSGPILCTQNEARGFHHITFYPDRPDVMSRFVTEITADKVRYPRLLSNGNLMDHKDLPQGRHYVRWEDPFAKPAYLYALVAGDLDLLSDSFTTCSGRRVALEIYTDQGKTAQARHAMESLKLAMRWDEQHFGREYDLNLYMIVAVDSFNLGAMENKGLNIFNSSLIFASETTATDETYERIATVIAHEYFHNWTGNRITCRDWFQLTLKEGLTVYRDELFSETQFGREVYRVKQVDNLRNNQYPEDAGPNRHPIRPDSFVDVDNFYTQTVYEKGAAVIRMMAFHLGQDGFRKGMDCYFERFDGQAVSCDDFVDAIQDGGGKDLSLLRRWYEQAGTPQLYVRSEWDGANFVMHLKQENPNAAVVGSKKMAGDFPPLAFPLPLALYDAASGQKLCEDQILISERETRLHYPLSTSSKPVPSLLLDHISPLEVHYDYSDAELLRLISSDQDALNRYEAMQRYLQNLVLGLRPAQDVALDPKYVAQIRNWLQQAGQGQASDDSLSPRYLAQLLQAPSLETLAARQTEAQFLVLQQLRTAYCREFARQLEDEMLDCYHALHQEHYERSELAVGRRALRNTLLHYLCHLEATAKYPHLAYRQYQAATNMTDSYAALQALACWPTQHSSSALQHFCARWQDNFPVVCRWFALQARVPETTTAASTLEQVRKLERHPLFQNDNPNMLRSLYSVLGHNLSAFHNPGPDSNWPAYDFLAQRILQIDRFNSIMAAKLAKCFVAYKRLDTQTQQPMAMGNALKRILENPGISERLCEIVSKTLGS